ncbi:hypothetical protein Tco_0277404 [Tanacetum coccineum]
MDRHLTHGTIRESDKSHPASMKFSTSILDDVRDFEGLTTVLFDVGMMDSLLSLNGFCVEENSLDLCPSDLSGIVSKQLLVYFANIEMRRGRELKLFSKWIKAYEIDTSTKSARAKLTYRIPKYQLGNGENRPGSP